MPVREDSRHVRRKVSEDEDDGSEVYLIIPVAFCFRKGVTRIFTIDRSR